MLYLHIPFCKQACYYCNFHFSTSMKQKDAMVNALLAELELRRDYLADTRLGSVYFGGGTPSLLETRDLERIFEKIHQLFQVEKDAEITLEANPDDLSAEKLRDLRNYTPVNRLSIGIQSFSDADLKWMNRAHQASEARQSLENALSAGFHDLTIDLIYGAPTTSDAQWHENLALAFEYGIPHLSCYCLTVEEGTALGTFVRRGQQPPVEEEKSARQFEYLMQATAAKGYDHYEISNFALPGRYARHNGNYWRGEHYLGIGPSAHSFDGVSRQWNIANNALYIKALDAQELSFEREVLTPEQRFNEYIMTALRTIWGVEMPKLASLGNAFSVHFEKAIQPYLAAGTVERHGEIYRLTRAGKLLADRIAMELFL
ncbi:MAG TPA: radical SAM family heme chaperone HemW [Saprospiraceae bacterium]|nr:radical SAM family heme chaperone HemW [Saprospiraceae bacterium]HPI08575.1 radical SAM family heme chaperone HemW [Saprospiraceae bacterium]